MAWTPGEGYRGSFIDLLESLFRNHYPSIECATEVNRWLIKELRNKQGPFVIRHTKDLATRVQRIGSSKPRYYFADDFKISFDVIATDNEPTTSFYSHLLGSEFRLPINYSEALKQIMSLGILRKGQVPDEERFQFAKFKTGMNTHPKRPSLSQLKLCHIIDAGKGYKDRITEEDFLQRAFLNLNPLNLFPLPGNSYSHAINNQVYADLGEDKAVQILLLAFLNLKFQGAGSNAFSEYFSFLGKEAPSTSDCEQTLNYFKDFEIQFKPKSKAS